MNCSLPGFSIHGVFQARILEWVAISFSRGSSRPRDQTWVSRTGGRRFLTSEPPAQIREAEGIKKRWQEYTEQLYKKDLNDSDNHNGVICHLEAVILECEIKWALGSITTNRASGGDRIPAETFQILKDDAVEVLHSLR